jgi:LAO/AO transport system kinase
MFNELFQDAKNGHQRSIARCISLIENESGDGILELMHERMDVPVIGITGPPGAGKSTLVDQLIGSYIQDHKKVAILCIDPSSPYSQGAVLGDRIRMNRWYDNQQVFIRSLASRGSLGGLHPHAIEITSFLKECGFDLIIIETVGVGQSEMEIVSLADVIVLVLVPEAGDEIQFMKAGLLEGADIFVVNKSDRPKASQFTKQLKLSLHEKEHFDESLHVVNTVASSGQGIEELKIAVNHQVSFTLDIEKQARLIAQKAYQLISHKKMEKINEMDLKEDIMLALKEGELHLHQFIKKYI